MTGLGIKIDPKQMKQAQDRVDDVSHEAFQLALDSIFDSAIQQALLNRAEREDRKAGIIQP